MNATAVIFIFALTMAVCAFIGLKVFFWVMIHLWNGILKAIFRVD